MKAGDSVYWLVVHLAVVMDSLWTVWMGLHWVGSMEWYWAAQMVFRSGS